MAFSEKCTFLWGQNRIVVLSAADWSSSFPGTWLLFWTRKKSSCKSLSKGNYLRCEIVKSANGNCRSFECGLVCGMPQTAFLSLPLVPAGNLRQLQQSLWLLCTPVFSLEWGSFFLVSVSHLDQAVKLARAFIPNQVPQTNISATQWEEPWQSRNPRPTRIPRF